MNWMKLLLIFVAISVMTSAAPALEPCLPLAGAWRFQLDRLDAGVNEAWFNRALAEQIKLPGDLTGQGIGDDITPKTRWVGGVSKSSFFTAPEYAKYREPGNVKVPFWLQPEKYFAGAAWYQREIEIPANWAGRRVVLFLERAHWETRAWVDGKLIGTNQSLFTPHEYDLGQLGPGKHSLTLRVDNRPVIDIGRESHGISDHTQANWNGVVGKIELRTTPLVWIEDVQVYPDVKSKSVVVKIRLGNATGQSGAGSVAVGSQTSPVRWNEKGGDAELTVALGSDAKLWNEFQPALQQVTVKLTGDSCTDERSVRFGLREVATDGTQFTLNGEKIFLRGTLECAIFPKTGHPPTDRKEWERIMTVARSFGLNHLRFHSWCPPEAAFEVADEMGFYFQIETCWANQSTSIGDGKPVDQWVYDETERILKTYGNHPSFLLMPYGNEPGGKNHKAYLAKYIQHFKALDARRLWASGSGWPEIPENEFHILPQPRIQQWQEELRSRINAKPPETTTDYRDFIGRRSVPVISHEIGQWCVYPNFDEIKKYTGYLKPKNFEIFRDTLEANGMGALGKQFLLASGKLQTLCYKEEIESALRTHGFGGFQLLDLHDFPGQGTALVGVLDPFWEEKGYVTAAEYRRFCNSTVPLARLKQRVFTTGETLEADMEVTHFDTPVVGQTSWRLVNDAGHTVAQGTLPSSAKPVSGHVPLGQIRVDLRNVPAPQRYKLVAMFEAGDTQRQKFENDWDIWVYPAKSATGLAKDTLVTAQWDDAARAQLAAGGKVLLTLPGSQVRNFEKDPVKPGFSSIFWNTAWTDRQAPTTLGILCDPKHPALAEFPTDCHCNWQWWYLIHRAGALRLELLPAKTEPVVRVIDDWVTARPLGLVVEGKIGKGKIIICGFDLTDAALADPVSRQMRASLMKYLDSDKCQPATELSADQIASLIRPPGSSSSSR